MTTNSLNPITLSVIWGGLLSTAADMGVTLARVGYSMAVREGSDYSTGIFTADGEMVTQGDYSPGHLGSMAFAVNLMLKECPRESLRPGDAILCNDPGIGSGHLPDVYMVCPAFRQDRLLGFSVNVAHHIDVGGAGVGSTVVQGVSDNYQEGIRFPPTMCYLAGEPVRDVFRIFQANVRSPEEVAGDLRAQYIANTLGVSRMQELAERYGADTLQLAMAEIISRSDAEMARAIESIPAGTYSFEDRYDDFGPGTPPIPLKATVVVKNGSIDVDWEGTGPSVAAGMNSYFNYTYAYTIAAVKSVTVPLAPQNAGIIRRIKVRAPLGSFLNPRRPAPCGGRNITSHRIYECVLGALSQAVPERVIPANSHFFNPMLGGTSPRTHKPFICWEVIIGGGGGRFDRDGLEATASPYNATNVPIELQEIDNPVLIERLQLIPDSGGAGRFRGGCGLRKDMRVLADGTMLHNLGDRHKYAPYGLFGGKPGILGATVLNPQTPSEQQLNSKGSYTLRAGDVVSWRTSGAGGNGDPFERDPQNVLADVVAGFVTINAAQNDYGVIIDPQKLTIDLASTERLRRRLEKNQV